ncbi:MAG: hypothetical protein ACNY01_10905 [Desulfobacteria bacterium]
MKYKTEFNRRQFVVSALFSIFSVCLLVFANAEPVCSYETEHAVVSTTATDESSGAHSWIRGQKWGGSRIYEHNMMPTIPDVTVAAFGQYYYVMERSDQNRITKFDVTELNADIWQYSTRDAGDVDESIPQDMIFVDENKAYLLRYGSDTAWIVNPSAADEADFKIGTLDLSPYQEGDGIPEMCSGVIVGTKLFITLQRLDAASDPGVAYIAVFDTATDTEIDTGKGADGMLGIPLAIEVPGAIQYLGETGLIYVQGGGRYRSESVQYTSGIETVDLDTYDTEIVLDDGDNADHPYGHITGMAVISADKGFFVGYRGENDNTLYYFDPSTGITGEMSFNVSDPNYLKQKNFASMAGGFAADQYERLWISNVTDAKVVILNTTPNDAGEYAADEEVSIAVNSQGEKMTPQRIVFCQEEESPPEDKPSSSGESGNFCFITSMANAKNAIDCYGGAALWYFFLASVCVAVVVKRNKGSVKNNLVEFAP